MRRLTLLALALLLTLAASSISLAQDEPDLPDPTVPAFDLSGSQVEPGDEPELPDPDVPSFTIPQLTPESSDFTRVIVGLSVPTYTPEAGLETSLDIQEQRFAIDVVQETVYRTLASSGLPVDDPVRFETIPYIVLEVDAAGLAALQTNPYVTSIQLDQMEFAFATEADKTYDVINSLDAVAAGYDGTSKVVAVIDQGTIFSHPAFAQTNVVAEACFTSNVTDGTTQTASTCPGSAETAEGTGAATPTNMTNPSFHNHGQHVTGTIAGHDGVADGFRGVAPDAGIIAINTFSKITTGINTGRTTSWISDSTRALEWIYDHRNDYDIVAVNMSLGGGRFFDQTTCAEQDAARGAVIDQLYEAGIVVIAASGNESFTDSISRPACHENAIAVGSTTVDLTSGIQCNTPSGTDVVSSFSNSASFLDLLAPGQCVYSSTFDDTLTFGYEGWQGTSMATPHVSGVWAILAEAYPNASAENLLTALKDTGVNVTDTRNSLTFKRVDVWAALDMSAGEAEALTPKDRNAGPTPTFQWSTTTYANAYRLHILKGGVEVSNDILNNPGCSDGVCSLTLGNPLALGDDYTWTITPINPRGTEGTTSAQIPFTVSNAPVVTDDFYTTSHSTPLTVDAANGVLKNDYNPGGGSLQALTATEPTNGTVTIQASGAFTFLPTPGFVGTASFKYTVAGGTDEALVTITIPQPERITAGELTLKWPSATLNDSTGNPRYAWTEVIDSTEYYLYVAPANNLFAPVFNGIVQAASICANNVCSVDLADGVVGNGWLVNGTYNVYMNAFPDNPNTWVSLDPLNPIQFVIASPPPQPITFTSVINTTGGSLRPTFNWTLTGDSTTTAFFQFYIAPTDHILDSIYGDNITLWLSRKDACGSWTSTTCSYTPAVDLQTNTHYQLYTNSWSPGGLSVGGNVPGVDGWRLLEFNMGGPLPHAPTGIQVNSSNPPTITWDDDALATSFSIWVGDLSDPDTWVFVEEAPKSGGNINCNGTTCSYALTSALPAGTYNIYMQAQGDHGHSRGGLGGLNLGWSEGPEFVIP